MTKQTIALQAAASEMPPLDYNHLYTDSDINTAVSCRLAENGFAFYADSRIAESPEVQALRKAGEIEALAEEEIVVVLPSFSETSLFSSVFDENVMSQIADYRARYGAQRPIKLVSSFAIGNPAAGHWNVCEIYISENNSVNVRMFEPQGRSELPNEETKAEIGKCLEEFFNNHLGIESKPDINFLTTETQEAQVREACGLIVVAGMISSITSKYAEIPSNDAESKKIWGYVFNANGRHVGNAHLRASDYDAVEKYGDAVQKQNFGKATKSDKSRFNKENFAKEEQRRRLFNKIKKEFDAFISNGSLDAETFSDLEKALTIFAKKEGDLGSKQEDFAKRRDEISPLLQAIFPEKILSNSDDANYFLMRLAKAKTIQSPAIEIPAPKKTSQEDQSKALNNFYGYSQAEDGSYTEKDISLIIAARNAQNNLYNDQQTGQLLHKEDGLPIIDDEGNYIFEMPFGSTNSEDVENPEGQFIAKINAIKALNSWPARFMVPNLVNGKWTVLELKINGIAEAEELSSAASQVVEISNTICASYDPSGFYDLTRDGDAQAALIKALEINFGSPEFADKTKGKSLINPTSALSGSVVAQIIDNLKNGRTWDHNAKALKENPFFADRKAREQDANLVHKALPKRFAEFRNGSAATVLDIPNEKKEVHELFYATIDRVQQYLEFAAEQPITESEAREMEEKEARLNELLSGEEFAEAEKEIEKLQQMIADEKKEQEAMEDAEDIKASAIKIEKLEQKIKEEISNGIIGEINGLKTEIAFFETRLDRQIELFGQMPSFISKPSQDENLSSSWTQKFKGAFASQGREEKAIFDVKTKNSEMFSGFKERMSDSLSNTFFNKERLQEMFIKLSYSEDLSTRFREIFAENLTAESIYETLESETNRRKLGDLLTEINQLELIESAGKDSKAKLAPKSSNSFAASLLKMALPFLQLSSAAANFSGRQSSADNDNALSLGNTNASSLANSSALNSTYGALSQEYLGRSLLTDNPTIIPTRTPTTAPTRVPTTARPTVATRSPTAIPTSTNKPTSASPTSGAPTTDIPTSFAPTAETNVPTSPPLSETPISLPTEAPISEVPTEAPISETPTEAPISEVPTEAPISETPTEAPISEVPTEAPISETPTEAPVSEVPTEAPISETPTEAPVSEVPTEAPISEVPTEAPISETPTEAPISETPTEAPISETPTEAPISEVPTEAPISETPTEAPVSEVPTEAPISETPTEAPISEVPTEAPISETPTEAPISETPTEAPISEVPTEAPISETPTEAPVSETPTEAPISEVPTEAPISETPTEAPISEVPTEAPISETPTEAPVSETPTEAPISETPITASPTSGAPTTNSPTSFAPTTETNIPTSTPTSKAPTSSIPTTRPTISPVTTTPSSDIPTSRPTMPPLGNRTTPSPTEDGRVQDPVSQTKVLPDWSWVLVALGGVATLLGIGKLWHKMTKKPEADPVLENPIDLEGQETNAEEEVELTNLDQEVAAEQVDVQVSQFNEEKSPEASPANPSSSHLKTRALGSSQR